MTEGIDSSLASVAAVSSLEDARSPDFSALPPLAWMAGVGALADLVVNRVLILLGTDVWSRDELLRLDGVGSFARNLSVVSALVALSFCLAAFSARQSRVPFSGRAGIASVGWVLIPIVTLMTFLPRGWTRMELVLVVAGLAHGLVLLLILAGVHSRSSRPISVALVLTLVAALSGFLSTAVSLVGERRFWEQTERLSNAFRWSGELAYLAVPLAVAFALAIPWREARGRVVLAVSALAATSITAGIFLWKHAVGSSLPDLLYGAVRLDFLPANDLMLYAIPLGLGSAITVAAALSKDPLHRQMGAALLLLLSAGYAPRTPSALIVMVLGVALLARVGIASAQRTRGSS